MVKQKKSIAMAPDFSPMKKKKKTWGNALVLYDTQVSVLSIAIPTHSDVDEALWMKPIVDAYEEDESGELGEK